MTFIQLCHDWLSYYQSQVSTVTYNRYANTIHQYILPFLEEHKEVDEKVINEYLNQQKNIEPTVLSRIRYSFIMIIKYAKKQGIDINIDVKNIKLPKVDEDKATITDEQAKALYHYCSAIKDSLSLAILLSMFTGMRIGEVCALKVSDIDLEKKVIHITKTMQKNEEGKSEVMDVSIWANKRDVVIPDMIMDRLEEICQQDKNDYVIKTRNNDAYEPMALHKRVKNLSKKLGFVFQFNYLRNYFFQVCMKNNIDIYTLMDMYGLTQLRLVVDEGVHQPLDKKIHEIDKIEWFVKK